MNEESWKDIPGYGGFYQASTLGRIRAKDRTVEKWHKAGRVIKQEYASRVLDPKPQGKYGYLYAHLGVDGKKISVAVHRLVLLAFVGAPGEGEECCHCNGIASDNRPENLRWDSHFNNNQDRKKHGTYQAGSEHPMAKFSPELVAGIKAGEVSRADAMRKHGVSSSQYHRIKKNASWVGV